MPTLVLLPGMDGTGDLFSDFVRALPEDFQAEVVRYPGDRFLSYTELMGIVRLAVPADGLFVLVAESFSTPLAVQYAATHPPNLIALVICAGFVTSPIRGWRRWVCSLLAPILFRLPLPGFVASRLLLGPDAPQPVVAAVLAAIASVKPSVLAARLGAVLTCDARAELAQVNVPLLYLQARHDRLVPDSCLGEMLQIKPNIEVASESGPHLLLQRKPQECAKITMKFVERFLAKA
jgi:pimeloyl-[acyl-carrier protein] methyl ester esterase